MAPTIEGQVEVNGLLMGPGTPYDLNDFNPWVSTVRADQGAPRAWNHGSWSGAEWAEQRTIPLRVHYKDTTTAGWVALQNALSAAFAPSGDVVVDHEMRFLRGGVEYMYFGRPRMVEPDMRKGARRSYARLAFVALDPLRYSGELHCTAPILLPVAIGGLTVPFTVPFTVPGTLLGGGAELVNAGTAQVGLSIRIDGPVSQPRVTLERADGIIQTLTIDIELDTGQFLEIVTGARTIFLNGLPQASRRGQASGTFPLLPPGTSEISFRAGDFNDQASATVCHRDGWF